MSPTPGPRLGSVPHLCSLLIHRLYEGGGGGVCAPFSWYGNLVDILVQSRVCTSVLEAISGSTLSSEAEFHICLIEILPRVVL